MSGSDRRIRSSSSGGSGDPRTVLEPGTLIGERYRLEEALGHGGMGSVYSARHVVTGRPFALKILRRDIAHDDRVIARFLREAKTAATIGHPNAIEVLDVFRDASGSPVMVMELLDGEDLGEHLRAIGRFSIEQAARILVPVLAALAAAHAKGIVHRDLKPENVFL